MAPTLVTNLILTAFFVLQICAFASARRTSSMAKRHQQWMTGFGRSYKDAAEKAHRFKIFKANAAFIDTINAAENRSYTLAINKFADLTHKEFLSTKTGAMVGMGSPRASSAFMYADADDDDIPDSIDWRDMGAVTEVKSQGQCGSCWAFSAVAATEGINQLTTGDLVSLSEQELIDCDNTHSRGCSGGYPDKAFQYIADNDCLSPDSDYLYEEADGSCSPELATSRAGKISGYEYVPSNDEAALMKAVANQPVSVVIDAGGAGFQFHRSGVFTGECGTQMNHAVAVVGYGESSDGIKYWLVKNSWGAEWGEDGYVKIQRESGNVEGLCGIAKWATYPVA
ncbi:zingipain-2-like isoform X1 [Salvia splendens]|uniref:zingipain-2-like isoform X1 n=2 Tax=Salvia splendens TaxID=180675 RepID=UPI001C275036|nr:zingipain-2-like isoform X1 [Salvia splendens]